MSVRGQPFSGGPRLPLSFGAFEQISMILGVASRKLFELAALAELLAPVGARGLEQPIANVRTGDIGGQERFADQLRDAFDDLRRGNIRARGNRARRLQRE